MKSCLDHQRNGIAKWLLQIAGLVAIVLLLIACNNPSPETAGLKTPVKGEEWKVTVHLVRNMGREFEVIRTQSIKSSFSTDKPNDHLLLVWTELERISGKPILNDYLGLVQVQDNTRTMYSSFSAGLCESPPPNITNDCYAGQLPSFWVSFKAEHNIKSDLPWSTMDVGYVFSVPNDATTFDFLWRDLPAIRLTVE